MVQQTSRSARHKSSKLKIGLQIALLLAVVVWLVHQINKDDHKVVTRSTLSNEDGEVDFGRKVKAGSENVIVVDGQKGELEAISESNDAAEQSDDFSKHLEEKNEEIPANTDQESSEALLNNIDIKDDTAESNTEGKDTVTTDNMSEDTKDVLQLPSERTVEQSSEQVEEKHEDEHNDSTTDDGANSDNGEMSDSDKQSSSITQELDGGEESEVSREIAKSQEGTGADNGGIGENIAEDDKSIINSENENDNFSQHDNGDNADSESSGKDKVDSEGDTKDNSVTTEVHTEESMSSETKTGEELSNLTEESTSSVSVEDETQRREAVESQTESTLNDEAVGNIPSVEESSTAKSNEDLEKEVKDANLNNGEISVVNEASQNSVVESTSNVLDVPISSVNEIEKIDTKSDEKADSTQVETPSKTENTGDHSNEEQKNETEPAEEVASTSNGNQEIINSQTSTKEIPNVEPVESQGDNGSDGGNTGSIQSDSKIESNDNTETSSE